MRPRGVDHIKCTSRRGNERAYSTFLPSELAPFLHVSNTKQKINEGDSVILNKSWSVKYQEIGREDFIHPRDRAQAIIWGAPKTKYGHYVLRIYVDHVIHSLLKILKA